MSNIDFSVDKERERERLAFVWIYIVPSFFFKRGNKRTWEDVAAEFRAEITLLCSHRGIYRSGMRCFQTYTERLNSFLYTKRTCA